MDSVPVSQILFAAAALAGEVVSPEGGFLPDADTLARFSARLNSHLPGIWSSARWPELVTTEPWRLYNAQYWTSGLRMRMEQLAISPDGAGVFLALTTAVAAPGPNPWPTVYLSDSTRWFQLQYSYDNAQDWLSTSRYARGTLVRFQKEGANGKWHVGYYVAADPPPIGEEPPTPVPATFMESSTYWIRVDTYTMRYTPADDVGEVLAVSQSDPEICENAVSYTWDRRGIRVHSSRAVHWFTWRLKAPQLTGNPWSEALPYYAGDQVYWATQTSGDFYRVLDTTAPGQDPVTNPELFQRIEIPRRFSRWLAEKVSADWLRWDGEVEKAGDREKAAAEEWDRIHLQLNRDQKQLRPLRVRR